jgi:hypothetical protein
MSTCLSASISTLSNCYFLTTLSFDTSFEFHIFRKTEKQKEQGEYKKHIEEAIKHIQIALERLHEEL